MRPCRFCSKICGEGSIRAKQGKRLWTCAMCLSKGSSEVATPSDIVVGSGSMFLSCSGLASVRCAGCYRVATYLSSGYPSLNGWRRKSSRWYCCLKQGIDDDSPPTAAQDTTLRRTISTTLQEATAQRTGYADSNEFIVSPDKLDMLKSWCDLQQRFENLRMSSSLYTWAQKSSVSPLGGSSLPTVFILTSGADKTSDSAATCASLLQVVGFSPRVLCGLDIDSPEVKNCIEHWWKGWNGAHLAWFLRFVVPLYLAMRNLPWSASVLVVEDSFRLAPGLTADHVSSLASGRNMWLGFRRIKKQQSKYGGYTQRMDADDILTSSASNANLPIGSKCFSLTKRGLLALWHVMLQTHSGANYHDWHSRCLHLSGILALQEPAIGGSAQHFSYQDRRRQHDEYPRCLSPEEVCKFAANVADNVQLPQNIFEPGQFGLCLADFEAGAYGLEYVSLRKGDLLVLSERPSESGWSYGWTVNGSTRIASKGWFPTTYCSLQE